MDFDLILRLLLRIEARLLDHNTSTTMVDPESPARHERSGIKRSRGANSSDSGQSYTRLEAIANPRGKKIPKDLPVSRAWVRFVVGAPHAGRRILSGSRRTLRLDSFSTGNAGSLGSGARPDRAGL
jgi:hypothetical protein